jgi:hypothetical protein
MESFPEWHTSGMPQLMLLNAREACVRETRTMGAYAIPQRPRTASPNTNSRACGEGIGDLPAKKDAALWNRSRKGIGEFEIVRMRPAVFPFAAVLRRGSLKAACLPR